MATAVLMGAATLTTTVVGLGDAAGETPAQRCKRETDAYNNTWKQAWVVAHPGASIDDAPAPNPPYICRDTGNDPPPTVTTAPPETTETAETSTDTQKPTADSPSGRRPNVELPTSTTSPAVNVEPGQPTISPGSPEFSFARLPSAANVLRLQVYRKNVAYRTIECTGNLQNVHQSIGNPAWMDVKARVRCVGELPIESAHYKIDYLKKRDLKFRRDQWNAVPESFRTHTFTGGAMYELNTIMSAQGTPCIAGDYQGTLSGYMVIGGAITPNYQLGYGNKSSVPCDK